MSARTDARVESLEAQVADLRIAVIRLSRCVQLRGDYLAHFEMLEAMADDQVL